MANSKILVVDDHANIREVVRFALEENGFRVQEARNGIEALDITASYKPDLIVLDVMMPEMDGTELCGRLRKSSNIPIIFLSSKDEELDRILGLELGGDDYLTKPFSPRELVARIRSVLRRIDNVTGSQSEDDRKPLVHDNLRIDPIEYKAYWQNQELVLTVTEFQLLRTLIGYPGKVYSRDELIDRAYDDAVVSHRTVDSHVRRIRGKIAKYGGDPIETVHGVGYKLRK